MKKAIVIGLAAMLLSFSGCGIAKEDYQKLMDTNTILSAENDSLKEQLAAFQQEKPAKACVISGSFIATVRKLIPDYIADSTTPAAAVVTQFQGSPFVVVLGPELIGQVEEGNTYKFTVRETQMDVQGLQNPTILCDPQVFLSMNIHMMIEAIEPSEPDGVEASTLQLTLQ